MLIHAAASQLHRLPLHFPVTPAIVVRRQTEVTTPFCHCRYPLHFDARQRARFCPCSARRRVRYEEEDVDNGEEYGHNAEIAMLESYSESTRSEVLLVRATVDNEEEEVLIFKGFSSCLSARTAADPSKSVLPAKAVIQSIDVIKGPFDPSNIEYLEKGLTWEAFKARLQPNRV